MSKPWVETKGPGETKRYSVDWSSVLNGESITTSDWTVIQGTVTLSGSTFNSNIATILISGGVVAETPKILNHIVTNSTPPQVLEVICVLTIADA